MQVMGVRSLLKQLSSGNNESAAHSTQAAWLKGRHSQNQETPDMGSMDFLSPAPLLKYGSETQ